MKIAFISDSIFPYNEGGKEKRIFEVTTRLAKKGHDIHIYCMKWGEGPKERKKIIATWHEVWGRDYWREYLGWRGIFGYLTEKLSIFMPDEIISVSGRTTKKLKENLRSQKKIYTIPNGANT